VNARIHDQPRGAKEARLKVASHRPGVALGALRPCLTIREYSSISDRTAAANCAGSS
jgi:hypothetical protein